VTNPLWALIDIGSPAISGLWGFGTGASSDGVEVIQAGMTNISLRHGLEDCTAPPHLTCAFTIGGAGISTSGFATTDQCDMLAVAGDWESNDTQNSFRTTSADARLQFVTQHPSHAVVGGPFNGVLSALIGLPVPGDEDTEQAERLFFWNME